MMEISLIDFDGKLQRDFLAWCARHQEIAKDEARLERAWDAFYQKWYDQPKKWLDGRTPQAYFLEIEDCRMLATLMIEYVKAELHLPEPLVHAICHRGAEMHPLLVNMLMADDSEDMDAEQLETVQAHAVAFIEELDLAHPYARYIELLVRAEEAGELTEEICPALDAAVEQERAALLAAYGTGTAFADLTILDMLSGLEGDKEVFRLVAARFAERPQDRTTLAGCFGRLRLEEGLPYLQEMLERAEAYYPYRAALEAWEAITGEELEARAFEGDPDYDRLAGQTDDAGI